MRPIGQGKRQGTKRARGIGAALSQVDQEGGEEASEVLAILSLEPQWVTEAEADDFPIVHGNGQALHDRAAALAGEDGITVNILLLSSCPASGAGDNPEALASSTDRSASITVAGHTRYTALARAEFDPRWIPRWLFDRDEGCDDRVGSRFEKSRTQLAIAEMAKSAPANLRSFSRVCGRVAAGVRGR